MSAVALKSKEKEVVVDNSRFQLIVFKLGTEEYGLHIDQIKEVVLTPGVTKLPQTPPYIKGVANIRGNIIAIVDLEQKFGLGSGITSSVEQGNYTLVIESDEVKLGVLVREVPNTLSVANSEVEDASNIIYDANAEQSYIKGIVKKDNRLIIMIDIFRTLSEKDLAGMFNANAPMSHV
jgi:purine-binding chemotaxis protein CheW